MTNAVNIAQGASNNVTFRNKLINGNMVIDQRNAGASVSASDGTFGVDRWQAYTTASSKFTLQQNAGSLTGTNLPAGFTNYQGCTSSAATTVASGDTYAIAQKIEGYNFADLGWGTTNAKTVTLSAWVYSSLTGTFGGSLANSALTRSYPFTFTISSANTWTQISITVAGDTSGTWIGATNGIGCRVIFNLGSGSTYSGTAGAWASADYRTATSTVQVVATNGATFYFTGVQLEAGTTASPFEYRQYGTELALCQRYYERSYDIGQTTGSFSAGWRGTNTVAATSGNEGPAWAFAVPKRTAPTVTFYQAVSGAAGYGYQVSTAASIALGSRYVGQTGIGIIDYTSSGGANSYWIHFTASAEL